jgi:hypothetical protein
MNVSLRELVGAIMASVFVVTFCFLVAFDIVTGKSYNVPDAFLAIVVSVVSYFFGQHAATNGAYAAGVTAAQAAAAATLAATNNAPPK